MGHAKIKEKQLKKILSHKKTLRRTTSTILKEMRKAPLTLKKLTT